jgi:hypothetical protein
MKTNIKYRQCISVKLVHGYFQDGKSNGFHFKPVEENRKRERPGAIVCCPGENGFSILEIPGAGSSPGNAEVKVFDIAAYSKDPLLGNYSNLETDQRSGKVYYIGNGLKNAPENGSDKRLTLSRQHDNNTWEAVQVLLQPREFVISPREVAPGDVFTLKNIKNTVTHQWTVKNNHSANSFYVKTHAQHPGFFLLEKNNEPAACYYADDRLYLYPPLFIAGMALPAVRDEKNGIIESKDYILEIAPRAVTWQYHVKVRANGKRIKNLQVRDNSGKQLASITFAVKHIDEQESMVVFASNRPIPLTEKPYKSIELIETGNSSTPLIPHLPNAGISSLHFVQNQWVAQMYVYV